MFHLAFSIFDILFSSVASLPREMRSYLIGARCRLPKFYSFSPQTQPKFSSSQNLIISV